MQAFRNVINSPSQSWFRCPSTVAAFSCYTTVITIIQLYPELSNHEQSTTASDRPNRVLYIRAIPNSTAIIAVIPFADKSTAALALVVGEGDVEAEVALELGGAAELAPEAVGSPAPETPLPVKGPGAALAFAPTPLRLGMGVPGVVAAVPIAVSQKASQLALPVVGALIVLNTKIYQDFH